MNKILKKVLAFARIFAMLLNISVFASDITPEEKGERKILMTRGGTELSADAVATLQSNLNRYSPLAMGSGTDSGIPAYHLTNNTTANIDIVSKEDKDGIDIIIKPGTKKESIHIPVLLSESGIEEMVYEKVMEEDMER